MKVINKIFLCSLTLSVPLLGYQKNSTNKLYKITLTTNFQKQISKFHTVNWQSNHINKLSTQELCDFFSDIGFSELAKITNEENLNGKDFIYLIRYSDGMNEETRVLKKHLKLNDEQITFFKFFIYYYK